MAKRSTTQPGQHAAQRRAKQRLDELQARAGDQQRPREDSSADDQNGEAARVTKLSPAVGRNDHDHRQQGQRHRCRWRDHSGGGRGEEAVEDQSGQQHHPAVSEVDTPEGLVVTNIRGRSGGNAATRSRKTA